MAFCPECGKSVVAEATRCAYCQHVLSAGKSAAARFDGTLLMSGRPGAKLEASDNAGSEVPDAVSPAGPAGRHGLGPEPSATSSAKSTLVGTGLYAPDPPRSPAAEQPSVAATAVTPANPSAGVAPKIAAAAATWMGQPSLAQSAASTSPGAALGETPAGSTPIGPPEIAEASAHEPRVAAALEAWADAARADTQPPDPLERPEAAQSAHGAARIELDEASARQHLSLSAEDGRAPRPRAGVAPPMAAQATPRLRFDEVSERQPRPDPLAERKWLWISAAAIAIACLGLALVLAAKLSH